MDKSLIDNFTNSNNIKRILILGHTGFIGSHLEKHLRCLSPKIEVVGRSLPDIDLTKEKEAVNLSDLFDLETAVIMCAAIKRQFGDNLSSFWQNLSMSVNLCRLLERRPVRRFIFFSSTAIYGEDIHNSNITEQTPACPTSYYGMAKYTSEKLFSKVMNQPEQSPLLILRPPLIYGPGDLAATYGPAGFVKATLEKEQIRLWGDGSERREFIFVEDIVEIVCRLSFSEYAGVLNVASGRSYTFENIIEIISSLVPYGLKVTSRPRTKKKVDNEFCNRRFLSLLADFSFTGLEEGIKRTVVAESQRFAAVNCNSKSKE